MWKVLPAIAAAFLVGGVAYASTTQFESIRIGTAGEGGVTFFNGSIVNEGGAVTIADDLRVDGDVYNGATRDGDNIPLKLTDDVEITSGNGWSGNLAVDGDVSFGKKTGYAAIPAAAFTHIRGSGDYDNLGSDISTTDVDDSEFYAPVQLPHGAKVTKMKSTFTDRT